MLVKVGQQILFERTSRKKDFNSIKLNQFILLITIKAKAPQTVTDLLLLQIITNNLLWIIFIRGTLAIDEKRDPKTCPNQNSNETK